MYEALRPVTTTSPDGKSIEIAPGEVVVGFESWPLRNQLAAINMHIVRYRLPDAERLPLSARAKEHELRQERERLIAAAAQKESARLEAKMGDDDGTEAVKSILRCKLCDYTTHSQQGLKTHLSRKHKA